MGLAKIIKKAGWVGILIGILAIIAVIGWPSISAEPQKLASFQSGSGHFLVLGETNLFETLVGNWTVSLWWKRSSDYWACYSLDGETTRWKNVSIEANKDHVVIRKAGKIVADLNTGDSTVANPLRNTVETPIELSTDPLSRSSTRIYPNTDGWADAWREFSRVAK